MAKTKASGKDLLIILGLIGLVADLVTARDHRQTCPKCLGRDYLQVALDVAHLAQLS